MSIENTIGMGSGIFKNSPHNEYIANRNDNFQFDQWQHTSTMFIISRLPETNIIWQFIIQSQMYMTNPNMW